MEEAIRRSRFITTVGRASTEEEVRTFVEAVRREFPDATHHAWACVTGPPGSTRQVGMSDDGEPHGTAGRPMLQVLLHAGVGEVVAVGTRFYGGTKLGRGGLGRAYAGGVQEALRTLALEERVNRVRLRIRLGYAHVDPVWRALGEAGGERLDERFLGRVELHIGLPAPAVEAFQARVADLTAGEAEVTILPLPEAADSDRSA